MNDTLLVHWTSSYPSTMSGVLFRHCIRYSIHPNSNTATLTFGHYFGFCQGEECIEIFKLTNSELSEDTTDQYPGQQFYNGMFIALSQEKFVLPESIGKYSPLP